MSDKKEHSNRKILIVILLLIFVGAGIIYYTMNLDQGEFAEPMNENELELLKDDGENDGVDDIKNEAGDDFDDDIDDDINGTVDNGVDDNIVNDIQDDINDNISDDIDDTTNDDTTSSNDDELIDSSNSDDLPDPEEEISQIEYQDISDDIKQRAHEAQTTDDPDDSEDEKPVTSDTIGEDKKLASSDAIDESQEKTTEEEGIIDQIISFLSNPFRSDDSEEISEEDIDDTDDIENINDIDDITEENPDQTNSGYQLESKNLVILGIDDLSEDQDLTFDFIGLISFNADNLEIEFTILPSRHTYEDQELRELSQEQLTTIITELTGLQIDYELVIDYSGFQYYVDEINGIELELSNDFTIPDLDLELTRGINQLDGTEALNYARFYNPDNGERSRINRQQEVIDKIYYKSLRLENILRLPGHYNHLINEKEAVKTDIDQELIRNIIRYIRQLDQLSIKYSILSN